VTDEQEPKKKNGRPKNPPFSEMQPMYEYYVKLRDMTRKSSKRPNKMMVEVLKLEREAIGLYYGIDFRSATEEQEEPKEEKPKFNPSRD